MTHLSQILPSKVSCIQICINFSNDPSVYTVPSQPENVVSEIVGPTWIVISWDSVSVNMETISYIVTAAKDGGNVSVTVDGSTTRQSVNVTGLQPETEYTITVVALYEQASPPSDPIVTVTSAKPGKQQLT